MKALKYSSVFKKVEEGARVKIAYDNSTGFALIVENGHIEMGLEYKGPNNRLFVKELKKARNWTVRDEMEVVDFQLAQEAAFNAEGVTLQRLNPLNLKDGIRYAGTPVDTRQADLLRSMLWIVNGGFYGTDGYRMHRAIHALPAPEAEGQTLAFAAHPSFIHAFLGVLMLDKDSVWAGVIYEQGRMRLVGGNDYATAWVTIKAIEGEESYLRMTDYFQNAENEFVDRVSKAALVREEQAGAFVAALEAAPRLGEDGSCIGVRVSPDAVRFLGDDHKVDEGVPAMTGVVVMPGAILLEREDYISAVFNHKFLTAALDFPGRATMLVQTTDYLWGGDASHTCILMPRRA